MDETSWLGQLVAARARGAGREDGVKGGSGGHSHQLGLPWVTAGETGWPLPVSPSTGDTPFSQLALRGNLFPNRAD